MRVRSSKTHELIEGAERAFWIDADGERIEITCKVVWLRKVGIRSWDVGMNFVSVPDKVRQVLSDLARGIAGESDVCRDPEQFISLR